MSSDHQVCVYLVSVYIKYSSSCETKIIAAASPKRKIDKLLTKKNWRKTTWWKNCRRAKPKGECEWEGEHNNKSKKLVLNYLTLPSHTLFTLPELLPIPNDSIFHKTTISCTTSVITQSNMCTPWQRTALSIRRILFCSPEDGRERMSVPMKIIRDEKRQWQIENEKCVWCCSNSVTLTEEILITKWHMVHASWLIREICLQMWCDQLVWATLSSLKSP